MGAPIESNREWLLNVHDSSWCNWNPNHRTYIVWGIDWRRLWLPVRTLPFGAVESVEPKWSGSVYSVTMKQGLNVSVCFSLALQRDMCTVYSVSQVLKVLYYCSSFNQENGGLKEDDLFHIVLNVEKSFTVQRIYGISVMTSINWVYWIP